VPLQNARDVGFSRIHHLRLSKLKKLRNTGEYETRSFSKPLTTLLTAAVDQICAVRAANRCAVGTWTKSRESRRQSVRPPANPANRVLLGAAAIAAGWCIAGQGGRSNDENHAPECLLFSRHLPAQKCLLFWIFRPDAQRATGRPPQKFVVGSTRTNVYCFRFDQS